VVPYGNHGTERVNIHYYKVTCVHQYFDRNCFLQLDIFKIFELG
jgi:hypothetical protein